MLFHVLWEKVLPSFIVKLNLHLDQNNFYTCFLAISSTDYNNYSLVYRLFVKSIEVNRLDFRLVDFQIFYKRIIE